MSRFANLLSSSLRRAAKRRVGLSAARQHDDPHTTTDQEGRSMRALVTGGAGHIGAAISARLVGDFVVTVADLAEPPSALAAVIDQHLTVDVASEHGAREAVRAAAGVDGLDVLVNCLGVLPRRMATSGRSRRSRWRNGSGCSRSMSPRVF